MKSGFPNYSRPFSLILCSCLEAYYVPSCHWPSLYIGLTGQGPIAAAGKIVHSENLVEGTEFRQPAKHFGICNNSDLNKLFLHNRFF